MKLTDQELLKNKFIGLYVGSEITNVLTDKTVTTTFYGELLQCNSTDNDIRLYLTPLSKISDEDALEVAKLNHWMHLSNNPKIYINGFGDKVVKTSESYQYGHFVINKDNLNANHFDFLRSKGYALPYMGITVEDQIKNKWIKLK